MLSSTESNSALRICSSSAFHTLKYQGKSITMDDIDRPTLVHPDSKATFPLELVQAVNRTYLLHLLAIDPNKILPPGKSLISFVIQEKLGAAENVENLAPPVQDQVTQTMRRAFWDTTAEKLSSPIPSEQNVHLKRLFNDLYEAISPLLPPQDTLLRTLSLPPPPSIAPLYSFAVTLRDILVALRKRCAPIRDSDIDFQLKQLDHLPLRSSHTEVDTRPSKMATLVTHVLEAIMTIIDHMKSDLHDFLLGSMSDEQLRALVMQEAKSRERALVIRLWSFQNQVEGRRGEDIIREAWRSWCNQSHFEPPAIAPEDRWKSRLLHSLSADQPVCCLPPGQGSSANGINSPPGNVLPPQLFFSSASLYKLQDFLQAVVIAAALRSLTRLPPPASTTSTSSTNAGAQEFMKRIWVLLEAELDVQQHREGTGSDDSLKLINLEDEVVRARQLVAALEPKEEQKLRKAVRRTLQTSDPAFALLQKRLIDALLKSVTAGLPSRNAVVVPGLLKAGRSSHGSSTAGKRLKLMISDDEVAGMREIVSPNIVGLIPPIKGFEDPVLSNAIKDGLTQLSKIIGWTENVWGDLV
ncbi:hypothetical protein NP233_g5746 [Leucocoprinus birnbaumii]|uniref:Uncharacterized protein n=1 Tax=Leucocoprinus birnbaumii TaxID=56174 RepID=A0AAD5VSM5_9AGAR|nr:hypothetical protein NP233_g5746 [Leucocoprinus birnbaumii]